MITKINFFKPFFWKLLILPFLCMLISCASDDEKKAGYDPTKPSRLTSFYPNEGKFQEKVLLDGENFPTDHSLVKVYFNQRQAPVIGGTVNRMYVMAPRLPGHANGYPSPGAGKGVCEISVVIGNDSLVYTDTFLYEESITVTTVAGNGNADDFQEGDLANAILQPRYICADKDGNIFIANWDQNDKNLFFCRLNEEENTFVRLQQTSVKTNIPCADPVTGVITVTNEATIGSFITCNPSEYWAPREREMKFTNGLPADNGWKHCMVVNPTDNCVYVRWYGGPIVRINQTTYEAYIIADSEQGDTYGLTFRPDEPNIMYMAYWGNGGRYAHSIVTVDVSAGKELEATNPAAAKAAVEATLKRVSSSSTGGGHRDGDLSMAQFRDPSQIYCDAQGFIYVADSNNHCIRRITPENQVETVLGVPGVSGWKDGTRDEALFSLPRGIAISLDGSVYVADLGNSRLRKLSVN